MKTVIIISIILFILTDCKWVKSEESEVRFFNKIEENKELTLKKWLAKRKNKSYFNCELVDKRNGISKKTTLFINNGFLYIVMKYDEIQNNYPLIKLTTLEQPEYFIMPKTFPPTTVYSISVKASVIDKNDSVLRVIHTLSAHEEIKINNESGLDQRIYTISLKKAFIEYESKESELKDEWPY